MPVAKNLIQSVLDKLLAVSNLLPAGSLPLLGGLLDTILSSKSPDEAKRKLEKAALAAGYKAGAREAMKQAANLRSKL